MKTVTLFFALIFAFSFSNSFSQEQVIKLKLEEGHEYIFEKVDKIYAIKEDESKDFKSVKLKEIRIVADKIIPEESIEFTLQFLKNSEDQSSTEEVLNRTDYFYPNFNAGEIGFQVSNFIEPLSCRSTFQFSINLKTNEITLLNRSELLEQFYCRQLKLTGWIYCCCSGL